MTLVLQNVRLPLASFSLELELTISAPVTALFGASGSGKTSLLEIIAGLRRPNQGRVLLDDTVLADSATGTWLPPERRAVGYVPQEGALFPHLSVEANLRYARPTGPTHAGLTYAHVVEVLEIGALTARRIASLSGGEKQRVALGRALLSAPRLLLLDEPLAGLDFALKERLLPYLRRVRDEFAIPMLYVTHSADEVVALCHDAIVLERGRVARQGKATDLFVPATTPRYELK